MMADEATHSDRIVSSGEVNIGNTEKSEQFLHSYKDHLKNSYRRSGPLIHGRNKTQKPHTLAQGVGTAAAGSGVAASAGASGGLR